MDVTTIWVCIDCTMAEQGFTEDELGRPYEREPWALLPDTEVHLGLVWGEHDEGCANRAAGEWVDECNCEHLEFSKSPCDGCGCDLAGSREAYTLFD